MRHNRCIRETKTRPDEKRKSETLPLKFFCRLLSV